MMKQQSFLTPLIGQLDILVQVVQESPYLSPDSRKGLESEIYNLNEQFKNGTVSFPQGEQTINKLNKKAADDELASLITKIYHLNPSSPRLETLRDLSRQLVEGEVSPEQVRRSIIQIMHA